MENEIKREQFEKIISEGEFDKLIGKIENYWLECKSEPYGNIKIDSQKAELAKDVSSLANLEGGYILIGVKTEKHKEYFADKISEIRTFKKSLVNIEQYKAIIKDWIYPNEAIEEIVNIFWKESKNNNKKGLIIIEISKPNELNKPFLLDKPVLAEKINGGLVGFYKRLADKSEPLTTKRIHQIIQMGLSYENNIEQGFSRLESLIKNNKITTDNIERDTNKKIEERLKNNLEYEDINKNRNFSLIIYPKNPNRLRNLFDTGENTIRKLLENPPSIRPRYGWNIETRDKSKIIRGKMIRVTNSDRKVLDLYEDGMFIFSALANDRFLGWTSNLDNPEINSLALIETTFSFLEFYKNIIPKFEKNFSDFRLKIIFDNMHLNKIKGRLNYGNIKSPLSSPFDYVEIKENSIEEILDISTKNFDSEKITYEIVKKIFQRLEIAYNVPYIKEENGVKKIDTEFIKGI